MGVFKLGKMTFGSLFKKPETVLYPIEKKPQPKGLKGHIAIKAEDCILCGMCQRGCPTDCITVDKEASTWSLMPFQCIQCGYCTQVCPKKCLSMDPNYWGASVSKELNLVEIPSKEKPAAKVAEAKPAAKEADAKEAVPPKAAETSASEVAEAVETAATASLDSELESKLAIMDAEKAERVRKALMSR